MTDDLGRPTVAPSIKDAIDASFKGLQGRGAILVIADEHGTRGQLAANLPKGWKVAGGGGMEWADKKPMGYVAVARVW